MFYTQSVHFGGGDPDPPNTWFIGPIRVHTPYGISIGSVVLSQLMGDGAYYTYIMKGGLKTRDWKSQDWKTWDQIAGVEKRGLENTGPNFRGGKGGAQGPSYRLALPCSP